MSCDAQDLTNFIREQGSCGIVYAHKRATCDALSEAMKEQDLDLPAYHAGMSNAMQKRSLTCGITTVKSPATMECSPIASMQCRYGAICKNCDNDCLSDVNYDSKQ
jgi:hypothetical protein